MCKAFSAIIEPSGKATWKLGMDSHTDLLELAHLRDDTNDPRQMQFARVEVTPKNNDYVNPDEWVFKLDQSITPAWWSKKHEESAFAAKDKWLKQLNKILVRKPVVHPFKIQPPAKITPRHVALLKQWASVWDSVWASVWDSVWASVGDSVWASVWASVGDSVRASVWASVGASVRASVRASAGAYTGSFFSLPTWKYVKHAHGKYPFDPSVKLWNSGLVPSFDGTTWRLHGGKDAKVLFEITAEQLRGKVKP